MAGGDKGEGAAKGARVRVLVAVLVVQILVALALIIFVIGGWPWVDRAPARTAAAADVDARFLPAPGDSVPTPAVDRFDSAYAFALLRRQVEVYGWRPAGSRALRRLAVDLRRRLGRAFQQPGLCHHRPVRGVLGGEFRHLSLEAAGRNRGFDKGLAKR